MSNNAAFPSSFKALYLLQAVDDNWLSLGDCEHILNSSNDSTHLELIKGLEVIGIPECEIIDHNIFTGSVVHVHPDIRDVYGPKMRCFARCNKCKKMQTITQFF